MRQEDNKLSLKQTNSTFFFKDTTTADQQKRCRLIKKLKSHNAEEFRELNVNQFHFNITDTYQELEYIDDYVTPLIYCAHFGLKEIMKLILQNNSIDIDMQTPINKQTPLTVACICGNYQIVRILILGGAQVNKPNAMNQHPLTTILFRLVEELPSFENKRICFKIAQFLIIHGADPNWIIDKTRGYSLLHYFCGSKSKLNNTQKMLNFQIIKFLINQGADPFMKSLNDSTPEDLLQNHCNEIQLRLFFKQIKSSNISKNRRKSLMV